MKKKKWELKMTRRQVLKAGIIGGAGMMLPLRFLPAKAFAATAQAGLSDPANQPMFANLVPDALAPGFKILTPNSNDRMKKVFAGPAIQYTGLRNTTNTADIPTPVWGYGTDFWNGGIPTWPGPTFEAKSKQKVQVRWENRLVDSNGALLQHLLPVDTTLHWCYSLPGYTTYSIANNGVPIVMHLHGGHTDWPYDGNPEFFFSPGYAIKGPRFVDKTYSYDNSQVAGTLWYHDHGLGITRLNVYAGLAGFYILRDKNDTGQPNNKLHLPAWPYEKAYAIQDRMFLDTGELFYPAYMGDFRYSDFIETPLPHGPTDPFYNGGGPTGPTALAEFFGDHMVVNGKIWPREEVEPRPYRLRFLNGCDSRFLIIRFRVAGNAADDRKTIPGDGAYVPFIVIGSDQGLASSPTPIYGPNGYLVFEPGSRYDIIIDFTNYTDKRIIMENIGGDDPFGGDIPGEFTFNETDRAMCFDVVRDIGYFDNGETAPVHPTASDINFGPNVPSGHDRVRKVALFEGRDEYNRLQPLLGTAEPATDYAGNAIEWPDDSPDGPYYTHGLIGPMQGSIAWHSPTTENPALGDTHPIHLHLVHFEVLGRQEINFDSNTDEDGFLTNGAADDGIYLVDQPVVQHNGAIGSGFRIVHPSNPNDAYGAVVPQPDGIVENTPKDMVTALPGQITRIKAIFDKPGRYVWHCHILSHEDHEMMRVLHVGPGA